MSSSNELLAMLGTQQGMELVEQVIELSHLRKEQEKQLSQLQMHENRPESTNVVEDTDRENVAAMLNVKMDSSSSIWFGDASL